MGISIFPAAQTGTPIRSFTALPGNTSATKTFSVSYPAGVYRLTFDDKNMTYQAGGTTAQYVSITDSEGTKQYQYSWAGSTSGTNFINTDRYFYSPGITAINLISYLSYQQYVSFAGSISNPLFFLYESSETNKYISAGGDGAGSSFQYGYSTNGSDWTFGSSTTTNDTRATCGTYFNGSYYVGAYVNTSGVGTIYSSTDGATWSRITAGAFGTAAYATDIAASSLGFVITLYDVNNPSVQYNIESTNGVTWNGRQFSPGVSGSVARVAASPTIFVIGLSNRMFYSTDRTTWTQAASNVFTPSSIEYNATPSQKFVAAGSSNSGSPRVYTSTDGITWTARTVGANLYSYSEVKYFNSNWYIFPGNSSQEYSYSTDGITWTTGAKIGVWSSNNGRIYDGTRHMVLQSNVVYASTNLDGETVLRTSAVLEGPFGGTAE